MPGCGYSHVLVEWNGPVQKVESILVPTYGGSHAEFAAEIAQAIIRRNEAQVDGIRVVMPESDNHNQAWEFLDSTAALLKIDTKVLEGDDIGDAITEQSATYDKSQSSERRRKDSFSS